MNYYAWKTRVPRSQYFSQHQWQLKKSKSWQPFWSYQLDSCANPSHLPRKSRLGDQVKESGAFCTYSAQPQPWWAAWQQQRSMKSRCWYKYMQCKADTSVRLSWIDLESRNISITFLFQSLETAAKWINSPYWQMNGQSTVSCKSFFIYF